MATTTGKKARRQFGTKVAAKRAKSRKSSGRRFGKLAYSVSNKNAEQAYYDNAKVAEQAAAARIDKGADPQDASVTAW